MLPAQPYLPARSIPVTESTPLASKPTLNPYGYIKHSNLNSNSLVGAHSIPIPLTSYAQPNSRPVISPHVSDGFDFNMNEYMPAAASSRVSSVLTPQYHQPRASALTAYRPSQFNMMTQRA